MGNMDKHTFTRLVRQALGHLYDHAHLQSHELSESLVSASMHETRGLALRQLLLEAIESLRPASHIPRTESAWRPYLALSLRYVEGLDPEQVADALCISRRQLRREQRTGLEALLGMLWGRYQEIRSSDDTPSQGLLDEELARLNTAAGMPLVSLEATVRGVASTLAELATSQKTDIAVALPQAPPLVAMERVALRQVLLSVMAYLLDKHEGSLIKLDAALDEERLILEIQCHGRSTELNGNEKDSNCPEVAVQLLKAWGGALELTEGYPLTARIYLPTHRAPTILIVDDNPEVVQLFRRYLGGMYNPIGANTSHDALRIAREIRPDAITLDVMMPAQDGWETLQLLRNHPATRHIPVVVCSVLREQSLALSLGASEFLAKPVTQGMLLAALSRCVAEVERAGRRGWPSRDASAPQS